jgi:lipopolysaccharide biosynthesis glycosyltransferase
MFVGYDPRESVAYHVFCQSVMSNATVPVAFHPLALNMLKGQYKETHNDGSNAFIYSRFLVPHLMGYEGWAIFCDGDMVCLGDIKNLWELRDEAYAAMVVKHNYQTQHKRKYIGTSLETVNVSYPKKNWSSVILWNCGHEANRVLTPSFVMESVGRQLHRFEHLDEPEIGELPKSWNWLCQEEGTNHEANLVPDLVHFTLGVCCIPAYKNSPYNEAWFNALDQVTHIDT